MYVFIFDLCASFCMSVYTCTVFTQVHFWLQLINHGTAFFSRWFTLLLFTNSLSVIIVLFDTHRVINMADIMRQSTELVDLGFATKLEIVWMGIYKGQVCNLLACL